MAQGDYLGIVMQSDIGAQGANGVAAQSALQSTTQTATTAKNDIDAIMIPKTIGPTALASFSDGVDGAILGKCVVTIEPVQSGSGDPSPTNVRPISGWTGAKVILTGKNLFCGYVDSHYNVTLPNPLRISGAYTFSVRQPFGTGIAFSLRTNNDVQIGDWLTGYDYYGTTSKTRTASVSSAQSKAQLLKGSKVDGGLLDWNTIQLQIEAGTEATEYEAPGTVYNISFPSEAGTVYGGTLDVGTGVLTVRPYYASYSGQSLIGPWISSHDMYTPGGTPTTGAQVVDMGGAEITYQLTPTQVRTLLGLNNIYADCGEVTVQYRGDVPNLYENVAVITEQKNKFYCPPLYQYDGEDLTVKFASEIAQYSDVCAWLKARLAAKDISGIFVKDFFRFTTSNNVTFTARIADINHDLGYGDTEVTGWHLDFICDELWPDNRVWNKVNYNNGIATEPCPWLCSDLYHFLNSLSGNVPNDVSADPATVAVDYTSTGVLDKFPVWLQDAIVERLSFEPTRYLAGSLLLDDTSMVWKSIGKLWIPSEIEYYGFIAWGTRSGFSVGTDHMYPLLRDSKMRIKRKPDGSRYRLWLRQAGSDTSRRATTCNIDGCVSSRGCEYQFVTTPVCFRIMAN